MRNDAVQGKLNECSQELDQVKALIDSVGPTSSIAKYLTRYSIIRACGMIEYSFKAIIADHCEYRCKKQVKRFLAKRVRENSANPSYDKICKFLNEFDPDWKVAFKGKVGAHRDKTHLIAALNSLVNIRNEFAHGGSPTSTITSVLSYYAYAKQIVEIIDEVVC